MRQINKIKSILTGESPVFELNDGNLIEELVIKHNDTYFVIDIDVASGDPVGSFGWSNTLPTTSTPIREHYHTVSTYNSEGLA